MYVQEKPMAINQEDAEEMIDLQKRLMSDFSLVNETRLQSHITNPKEESGEQRIWKYWDS